MPGHGQTILDGALTYGVNPALALGVFQHEGGFATQGYAARTNNPGNIIYTGGAYGEIGKDGRFGVYATMSDGVTAFFKLMARQYKDLTTVQQIINRYAPSSDGNNPTGYAATVNREGLKFQTQMANAASGNSQPPPVLVTTVAPPPSSVARPSTPILSSPVNDSALNSRTAITFYWGRVSNATQYYLEYWGGPYRGRLTSGWISNTSSLVGQMWPGTYSWHVKARNGSGESGWSATWSFTIRSNSTATITYTPTQRSVLPAPLPTTPSTGAQLPREASITFRWNAVSGANAYYIEYWGGPYSTLRSGWISGLSYFVGPMWPGVYSWHVKARNGSTESGWSAIQTFTIQGSVPTTSPTRTAAPTWTRTATPAAAGTPRLSSPANGDSLAQSTEVLFNWIPSSNANLYYLEYWGGPYSTLNSGWIASTTYRIGQMWPGTYYWHVKARHDSGESGWSETWSFTIRESTPSGTMTRPPAPIGTSTPVPAGPSAPTPINPSNGSSYAQSNEITLSWNVSSTATQYKVELWGGPYDTMTPCDWQGATSCHIGQMRPGVMYWHVKARASDGRESDWSQTWMFTIQDYPATQASPTQSPSVGVPTLSNPSNGGSYVQSTDITLSWNLSANATQYKVELWGGPYSTMTPCDWQSGTTCHIGQMWPGVMYWHVKAHNASSESAWNETWSFTIQDIPPTQPPPTLSSPSNSGSYPQSTDITLAWNTSANATQYKVELWGGPYSTMTPCDWQGDTSCHIGQMWPGAMYWHVKARAADGRESDWSETWSFTIQDFPPTQPPPPQSALARPSLARPSNGALLPPGTDVTLFWNLVPGAVQYKVELWGGVYSRMTPCDWQSGTTCHIGQMWPGNVLWRVKARDANGYESEWSEEWNFTPQ